MPLFIFNILLDVLILYSFVLISPWGWRFIPETFSRVHMYGGFLSLYKLCAFVNVDDTSHCTQRILNLTLPTYSLLLTRINITGICYTQSHISERFCKWLHFMPCGSQHGAVRKRWRLTSLLSLESAKTPKFLYSFSILSVLIMLKQITKL